MSLPIELEQEDYGRWIGEIPDLPGVLAYGATRAEAAAATQRLAMHVIAERIQQGEELPTTIAELFAVPV